MISERIQWQLKDLLDEIIDPIIENVDKTLEKYGCHDVDVRETVGGSEPLFFTCRRCKKSALNTGDGFCVGCRTRNAACQIVGLR